MIRHVDHINIVVRDMEKMVWFYTEVLGLEAVRRSHLRGAWIDAIVGLEGVEAEVVYVQPRDGGPRIELLRYIQPEGLVLDAARHPNTAGLRHIALRVDDIGAACERLRAHGAPPFAEPVEVPASAVRHDDGQKRLCYFLDPEGVLLELAEYV